MDDALLVDEHTFGASILRNAVRFIVARNPGLDEDDVRGWCFEHISDEEIQAIVGPHLHAMLTEIGDLVQQRAVEVTEPAPHERAS